ncbi:hypothetical protein WDU94_003276 [Cyamophila willieti]
MTKYIARKRKMFLECKVKLDHTSTMMVVSNVSQAVAKSMVFTLIGYYPIVRKMLIGLGWLEKIDPRYKIEYLDTPLITQDFPLYLDSAPLIIQNETVEMEKKEFEKRKLASLLLEDETPNLLISLNGRNITWSKLGEDTIVSHFPSTSFCSKDGLNFCLGNMRSFQCGNDSLKFPRSYTMSNKNDVRKFTQDFRETICFSLMRFVKESYETHRVIWVISQLDGAIPWTTFEIAETVCKSRLNSLQLENVAQYPADQFKLKEPQEETEMWLDFGEDVYNVTSGRSFFNYIQDMQPIYIRAKKIIESFEVLTKQNIFDGAFNTWVVKLAQGCSGYGIKLHRKIGDIKQAVYPLKINNDVRFILQKYIERPLLIHGVKFDLRVWYLVTTLNKMKIWVYQEGYVRFCSKPHSNVFLEESRHLSNVRIQVKYRARRHPPQLSPELMWDFERLRAYFTMEMNLPNMWDNIMKAMEESITTIMKCAMSNNQIALRKNSFQLFGADFLIQENFQPCLIEVNNEPGLSPSTSIIAKKSTELLADITRVVNYERKSLTCIPNSIDSGNFHLIYVKDLTQPPVPSKEKVMQGIISTPINLKEWKKNARARLEGL